MPPRNRFFFEAPEDGGGGAPPPTPDPTPDPTPEEPEQWSLSRDDWDATQNYLRQAAPILEQMYAQMQQGQVPQQPQQPQLPDEFDPFDTQSVASFINAHIQHGISQALEQQLGPMQGVLGMVASREGEQLARTQLDRLESELGSFDRDAAFLVGSGLIQQGEDPSESLRVAAVYARDFEQRIREDERNRYKSELQQLGQAPPETPVGGAAGTENEKVPTGPRRYHVAVERAIARRNGVMPVG